MEDLYHFIIVNCGTQSISVTLEYTLLNKNGEQLPLGYIQLPGNHYDPISINSKIFLFSEIYTLMSISWAIMFMHMLFMWVFFRNIRYIRSSSDFTMNDILHKKSCPTFSITWNSVFKTIGGSNCAYLLEDMSKDWSMLRANKIPSSMYNIII
jgi:hypothetical protein